MLDNYIAEVLVSPEELKETIQKLGEKLTVEYQDKNPLVICILKGAIFFMTDLVRAMDCDLEVDFMDVSSYGDAFESSGQVRILKDLDQSVKDRHILIVEDIIDTGYTLEKVREILKLREPASLQICTLLDKPSRREVEVPVDWVGFVIPDEFVVGYGIDYAQHHRQLGYIGKVVLDE